MPPKRPSLGLAFSVELLPSFGDHDEWHPAPKCASQAEPASEITENIFIGSVKDLDDMARLHALGISHILNVAKELQLLAPGQTLPASVSAPATRRSKPSPAPLADDEGGNVNDLLQQRDRAPLRGNVVAVDDGDDSDDSGGIHGSSSLQLPATANFELGHVPLLDGVNSDTLASLDRAVAFIEDSLLRNPKAKVLVHCRRGISRSAAVVVAFLMKSQRLTYEAAVAAVKARRSIISLNMEFRENLAARCEALRQQQVTAAAAAAKIGATADSPQSGMSSHPSTTAGEAPPSFHCGSEDAAAGAGPARPK